MRMDSREWIEIEPSSLSHERTIKIRGAAATVSLSPYDVPRGIRAFTDTDEHSLVVEFRYLEPDEARTSVAFEGIRVELGRHSHRIYGIYIAPDGAPDKTTRIRALELGIKEALRNLEKSKKSKRLAVRPTNWKAASDAFEMNRKQILTHFELSPAAA